MPLPPLVEPAAALTTAQVQRYSRHLLLDQLGVDGQCRLLAARVLVVGAGGLGSPALLYLAAAGVGYLGIVDDDVVEASNLQRQVIHTTADIGRPKVDSAAERVAALNPDVAVTRHHLRLDEANAREVIAGYDVVLDGTDNFPTRYLVDDVCAELGIPLVWGSILRFDAQVSVFWSRPPTVDDGGRSGGDPSGEGRGDAAGVASPPGVRLRDLFPAPPPPGTTPSCGEAGVLGAMCGQVGSIMAAEAVKLITGTGEPLLGRVLVLDVLSARWSEVPLRARAPRRVGGAASTTSASGTSTASAAAGGVGAAGVRTTHPGAPGPDSCETDGPAPELPTISARALAGRLAARELGTDYLVLVDVREAGERSIVAIPHSVHIPLREVLADPAGIRRRLADVAGATARRVPAAGGARQGEGARGWPVPRVGDVPGGGTAESGPVPPDVVVHCRSGQRSAEAARALAAAGVRAVNLDGGILAWVSDVDPSLPTY